MKTRLLFFISIILIAGIQKAAATTYTWAGGSSGSWTTASNWSPSSGYPGKTGTTDIAIFNISNCTVTLSSTLTIGQLQTTSYGYSGNIISVNSGVTLNISAGISTAQPSSASNVFTFAGAGTTKISGTISPGYSASFAISSGSTVYLNSSAVLDEASGNPHGSLTNAGTLNILSGASLKFSDQSSLVNSGTIHSYGASFTFSGSGSPICTYTNTGTVLDHGSTMTFTGQGDVFQNSSSSAACTLHGTTITFSAGSNNQSIQNAGAFTIDSAAIVNVGTYTAYISNSSTGTFYAGTSNSACTINLTGQSGNVTNSGNFYLGSTSVINFGGYSAYLSNSGTFTIQSDAYGSGAIGTISNSASVSGTYNVQRYLQGGVGERNYRLMSSPVYAAKPPGATVYSINYLKNSIYLTGTTTTGGFDNTSPANPTLYLYRENQTSPAFTTYLNSNFIGIKAINNSPAYAYSMNDAVYTSTYTIPIGSGYLCFFRGDRSTSFAYKTTAPFPVPENTTLTATGTMNTGTVALMNWFNPGTTTLSFTAATPVGYRGFNLAGNPYPCTIDWETYQSSNSGVGIYGAAISSTIYELNPKTQNYDTYQQGGASTNYGTRYIASGQGFFVKASGTTSSLTFYETAKAPTAQNTGLYLFMGTPNTQTANSQHLKLQLAMDTVNMDDTYIGFNQQANSLYNDNDDAIYKVGSGKVSLASFSSDNVALAINKRPLPKGSAGTTIGLTINAAADGIYSMNMKELAGIPQLYDIWLMDAYKKDSVDMRANKTYAFNIYQNDTTSFGSHRFTLMIRENPAYAYHLLSFTASKINLPGRKVQLSWTTENEGNYTNFTVERSVDGAKTFTVVGGVPASGQGTYSTIDSNPADNNVYRLKSEDINNVTTYSYLVPINYTAAAGTQSALSIYPNPATTAISLKIAASIDASDSYNIIITNSSGLIIKQINTNQSTWLGNISNLQPGTYLVKVFSVKNGVEIGNTKFVKM